MMGILNRLATRSFEINHPTTSTSGFGLVPNMPSRFEYEGENSEIRPQAHTSKQAPHPLTPFASNETVSFNAKPTGQTVSEHMANPKIKNSAIFTKTTRQTDVPAPDYARQPTVPKGSSMESKNQHSASLPLNETDFQENIAPKASRSENDHKTPAPSENFVETSKEPEFVQPKSQQADRNEQTNAGFEEISFPSFPERLQPFVQPFESYLSSDPSSVTEMGNPVRTMRPARAPDVIIQIDHIEIQLEKKAPLRAQKQETKKAKLTDLSSYLSDQGSS